MSAKLSSPSSKSVKGDKRNTGIGKDQFIYSLPMLNDMDVALALKENSSHKVLDNETTFKYEIGLFDVEYIDQGQQIKYVPLKMRCHSTDNLQDQRRFFEQF